MEKQNHLSIRMDAGLHDKAPCTASYKGRSMSRHIITCVREFEKAHGPIDLEELS